MITLPEINSQQNVFIYGFGIAGKWLSENINANIKGFIDTDSKKVGRQFNGYQVFSVEQARAMCTKDCLLLITVIDINDILSILKTIPHQAWVALGKYLNSTKVNKSALEESPEFIEYALKAVEECHKGFLAENKLFLRSVDIVITEKCSLKCKDCSNLMQYYEAPVDIAYDEIIHDFEQLTQGVDHVYEVRLIGGEPFMNKEIYKIIEYIASSPKISKLVVYSNAMIPIKMDQAHVLQHPKVVFTLTDYGDLAKNTQRVTQALDALNVAYRLHAPENWTDSGVIYDFKRSIEAQKQLFAECCGKNLYTVTDGKLYRCPFAANAARLKAIPPDQANAVSLDAGADAIRQYAYGIDYIPACNFCKGRSFGAEEITPAIQSKQPLKYQKFMIAPVE